MLERDLSDEELWTRVPTLPSEDVPALMEHPAVHERHLVKLLQRRDLTEAALSQIAHSRWAGTLRIQCALVTHPHTPLPDALNFVKFLFWRDLNLVTQNFQIAPEIRQSAENVLYQRLPAMAVGEKVTLARLAGGQVLKTLRLEKEPKVIAALLENPRLVEADVLYLISQARTPAPVLEAVARDPKWSARREVRIALLRNGKTPLACAVTFISSLNLVEIKGLIADAKVPLAIRKMLQTKLGKSP